MADGTAAATATVEVALGDRGYRVLVGEGLIAEAARHVAPLLARPFVAVVTDEGVARHHLGPLVAVFEAAGLRVAPVVVPAGEGSKSLATLGRVLDELLEARVERDDLIVALGGGVVGDLAGFAAAVLRRGVGFVQVPTSLLAQVDSSVGGKTGINARAGKNLIGAFHQPRLVLADVAALDTLPPRELRAGYAEVAKYGLLGDAAFFAWLEANGPGLIAGEREARAEAVRRSVAGKAGVVARDEREAGERALLNLGHTFGHALEAATGYSDRLLHGEGVALGMVLAFETSARMGLCDPGVPARVAAHLDAVGLPTRLSRVPGSLPDAEALIALMAQDKKVKAGRPVLILARGVGEAFVCREPDMEAVRAVLAEALAGRAA
jgi:3-dehydroquinate synthase